MRGAIRNVAIIIGLLSALLLISLTVAAASDDQAELLAGQPTPTEVIFQQGVDGYTGCEDTYIETYNAGENYCAEDLLLVRGEESTSALIRFDVSSIPSNATIVEAYLETYADPSSSSQELEVSVFGLLRDWEACEATWNEASVGSAWETAGAMGLTDRAVVPADRAIVSGGGWYYHNVTDLVQQWVLDSSSNKGILLGSDDPRYGVLYQFSSAECPTVGQRPRLRVKYLVTGVVPTPKAPLPMWPTTVMTFQQALDGYTGCADTYIDSSSPGANYGQDQVLMVRGRGNTSSLLKFDISGIPSDAVIFEAYLQMKAAEESDAQELQVASHAVQRYWAADEATWLNATVGTAWEGAGCTGETDRALVPSDREVLHGAGWCEFNVTDIVAQWLSEPGSNKGLLLEGYDDRWAAAYIFPSADHVSSLYAPRLIVTYARSPEAPTPTPTLGYHLYLPIIFRTM